MRVKMETTNWNGNNTKEALEFLEENVLLTGKGIIVYLVDKSVQESINKYLNKCLRVYYALKRRKA